MFVVSFLMNKSLIEGFFRRNIVVLTSVPSPFALFKASCFPFTLSLNVDYEEDEAEDVLF